MAFPADLKSPTFWINVAASASLIGQAFTATGNRVLAGVGAVLIAVYTVVKKLENIAKDPNASFTSAIPPPVAQATVSDIVKLTALKLQGYEITPKADAPAQPSQAHPQAPIPATSAPHV